MAGLAKPRVLVIGAGARGSAYSEAITESGLAHIAGVAEPIVSKRRLLGSRYIWHDADSPGPGQEFDDWQSFLAWEIQRRHDHQQGRQTPPAFNAIFVCVLDEHHAQAVTALATLNIHIMCEKPLAVNLRQCIDMYTALRHAHTIFGIGHVLRYSPHNILLRRLVLDQNVVGDILSIDHCEPVGWRHFSHSYVRGNWRQESSTAPSLLTKSCHDIDWLLWMLCSPPAASPNLPHLPSWISSFGSLKHFRRARKPPAAGAATNCLSCPLVDSCIYSAVNVYYHQHLAKGIRDWPVNIVNPDIESCLPDQQDEAKKLLFGSLSEDYDRPSEATAQRPWFGRCVWESDNDVCDDQVVTMEWEASTDPTSGQHAKTATFHMIAHTEKQCERRGRIYGSKGEIEYDGTTITVYDFATQSRRTHVPPRPGGGHGGGDAGLAEQFIKAVRAVDCEGEDTDTAQVKYMGCTHEDILRSHAYVFAAEEARMQKKVVDLQGWWAENVDLVVENDF